VAISVGDTGPGMQPEDVERIFEPFYTRKFMGHRLLSGLSMAVVYRVVEDHGGYIDVETGRGHGTKFMVYLPVARSDAQTLEVKADYSGTEQILVVDDYKAHRAAATQILENLGYRVLAAENGRAAVKLFEQAVKSGGRNDIHLAVIDLVLGDEFDGVETYKKLIEIRPGQKAILVSGFADINRIVEARKLGINRCLQKPYAAESLGRAIRQELDNE
jgi:CheY-like chemotaxis protein